MMLKIATWNVMKPASEPRQVALQQYVNTQWADVWVFTEMRDSFTHRLGFPHAISSVERNDKYIGKGNRWVTICSRWELKQLNACDKDRTVAVRVCPKDSQPFIVFGTVLPWHGDKWQVNESTGGVAYSKALELQSCNWKLLREQYPDDELFIAGDFNQDLVPQHAKSYYGSAKNRKALEVALESNGLIALTAGIHDPIRRDLSEYACIDHICSLAKSKWKLVQTFRWPETQALNKSLTDHFGVAVVLSSTAESSKLIQTARGMVRGMDTTIESEPDRTF